MRYLVKVFEVNLYDQLNIDADSESEAKEKAENIIHAEWQMDLDCFMVEVEPLNSGSL